MTDIEIQAWLDCLRQYHGADRVSLCFEFDDGSSVTTISQETQH